MYNKKLITALVALIVIPSATMAIGKHINSVTSHKMFSDNLLFDAREQASIVLAQNDKGAPEENENTESGSSANESDGAAEDDKKSPEAESKSPKPFVPSEQIAGEQAVDFPADI